MTRFGWLYKLGEKAYRAGVAMPPTPSAGAEIDDQAFWLGYMVERGRVWMARWRVIDLLQPDPTDPRPRKAA